MTASLFAQQVSFWDVSRPGSRVDFRFSLLGSGSRVAAHAVVVLVPDPIIHAPWWVPLTGNGVHIICSGLDTRNVSGLQPRARNGLGVTSWAQQSTRNHGQMSTRSGRTHRITGVLDIFACFFKIS